MEEFVFAIPSGELWELIPYQETGLITASSEVLKRVIQKGVFQKRSELEEDPSFKQIITYAIISYEESFFLFKRTSGQTEKRLHNKFSLGIGGHMNRGNLKLPAELYPASELKREFFEEVRLLDACSIEDMEFTGFINDDTIPVGRVHIGLLYNVRVSGKCIAVNEPDKMTAHWIDIHDLQHYYEDLETWSRIAFDSFIN